MIACAGLQGNLGDEIFSFPRLQKIDLGCNENLTGYLPKSTWSNSLSGSLPATFFKSFEAMKKANEEYGLHYMGYENNSIGQYQDSIEVIIKGLDIHLEKVLTVFTTIDVSNMFEGKVPQVIRELDALKGLNFSHHMLTSEIPSSNGNLRVLESLDLSSDKLAGKIPPELASLDSLGYLNLSQNKLEGCIPVVPHFDTFSNDSFKGNKGLHGFQLNIPCLTHEKSQPPLSSSSSDAEFFEFGWKPILLGKTPSDCKYGA
ncbi:receptor like protein 26-like [Prosopis cineraria]|uniref:receptor like protein 26-like n=1 Tax=Prosopis cineraria TaxID=364024 RepID=UPI00240F3B75|nr:receptor like protein 26-like [Prosopis cineraria]